MADDYDFLCKVILLGESGAGKSNLLLRFQQNKFNAQSITTIGVEFGTTTLQVDKDSGPKRIKAQLWDTAGQERFRAVTGAFFRGSQGVLLVYDISNYGSFRLIEERWMAELRNYGISTDIVTMLVGNKCDLRHIRAVPVDEARDCSAFADKHGFSFIETSALDSTNVKEAFNAVIEEAYRVNVAKRLLGSTDLPGVNEVNDTIQIETTTDGEEKRGCCFLS